MTCIVGVLDGKGGVVMGGDSAGIDDHQQLQLRADAKVFHLGPFLIGIAGSWRLNQVVKYKLKLSSEPVWGGSLHEYMSTVFVDALRAVIKDSGCTDDDHGTLLVGYNGRLYSIYADFSVSEEIADYEACGCGGQIARGSLYSTNGHPPKVRVKTALAAAERFSSGVRGPFNILEQAL